MYPGVSAKRLNWKGIKGTRKEWNGVGSLAVSRYRNRDEAIRVIIAGEMKRGGKSKFRATISGKIDELPVGGQPVLCP